MSPTIRSMEQRVRAVVVDDHPFYRDGISRGLAQSGRIVVVGEAGDGREGLQLIREEDPDVAVVDVQMPVMNGTELVQAVVRDKLRTRTLLLSAVTDSAVVFQALQDGASGYLAKDTSRLDIVAAVIDVAHGKTVLPAELAAGLVDQIRIRADVRGPVLSERETQVLQGFARGLSIPQLAQELFIGSSTVKTHTQRLYEKLGVSDRAAAVAEGMRRGLLD